MGAGGGGGARSGFAAIAAASADDPGRVLLAQHGSGQALYVGLADDTFIELGFYYSLIVSQFFDVKRKVVINWSLIIFFFKFKTK